MQHAVITWGGRQYLVTPGQRLSGSHHTGEAGNTLELPKLLEFDADGQFSLGRPKLPGAAQAKIIAQGRSAKVTVIKFKRKVRYRRKVGHRQAETSIEITNL